MNLRQAKPSPLLRSIAGATLALWLVALGLCFVTCIFGQSLSAQSLPSCHASATAKSCHQKAGPTSDQTGSSGLGCITLKTASISASDQVLTPPAFQLLYCVAAMVPTFDFLPVDAGVRAQATAWPQDWVFTPELFLGQANSSLAPPFFA